MLTSHYFPCQQVGNLANGMGNLLDRGTAETQDEAGALGVA